MNRIVPAIIISVVIAGGMAAVGAAFIRETPVSVPATTRPVASGAGPGERVAVAISDVPSATVAWPDDQDRRRILTPGIDEEAGHDLLVGLVAEARPGLVGDLAMVAADPRHAPGWRNYAIQHLATHHELHRDAASLEHLRRVAVTGDHHIRPVAIHGLARLATGGLDHLDDEARRIARGGLTAADPQVREAALRAAVLLGMDDALPAARAIVGDPDAPVALALAATDLLGLRGGSAELPLLEQAHDRLARSAAAGVLLHATRRALGRIRSDEPLPQRAAVAQDIVGVQ